jgi:RecA-family ATPase
MNTIDPLQLQESSLRQLERESRLMYPPASSSPAWVHNHLNSTTDYEYETEDDLYIITKSINHWMEEANMRPVPRMLFGKLWYEGELCILFADSNVGKSILAVQIGNAINAGITMHPFTVEAENQTVLYCDFELTDKQFEARYSDNYTNHYRFKPNFYRAEINPDDSELPPGFTTADEFLNASIERTIVQSRAKVIIIDNLTYLRTETEQAKEASPLMKHLKALKNRYNLSILVLAHTPKRDASQPISRNDLQGSKMLMNFCDSAFTIGESQADKSLRYIKQIKQRNTEQVYGGDNVCLCQIVKPDNFLQFDFVGYGREWDHLQRDRNELKEKLTEEVLALHHQGRSLREIGKELNIPFQKVDRLLKNAKKEAQ